MLEWGEKDVLLIQQYHRSGQAIPDRLINSPELQVGLEIYLTAFFELDSERQAGFAVGPIPWSRIREYALAYKFNEESTEDLFYYMKALDNSHMKRLAEKGKT